MEFSSDFQEISPSHCGRKNDAFWGGSLGPRQYKYGAFSSFRMDFHVLRIAMGS